MDNIEQSLASHPFAKDLEPRIISLIADCGSHAAFSTDEYIFREGESADRFYLINEGLVALELFSPGHGVFTFTTLNSGELLGVSWLAPPYRWTFDARAVEPTRAIAFDAKRLRDHCEADHHVGYEVLKRLVGSVTQRMQAARVKSADLFESAGRRAERRDQQASLDS